MSDGLQVGRVGYITPAGGSPTLLSGGQISSGLQVGRVAT